MGVQDLGVGRRIKIMAEGFHGRGLALRQALQGEPALLADVLRRNVFGAATPEPGSLDRLVRYVRAVAAGLAGTDRQVLLAGGISFPAM
jgi:cytochrome b pre-mRNA-processing protein 3